MTTKNEKLEAPTEVEIALSVEEAYQASPEVLKNYIQTLQNKLVEAEEKLIAIRLVVKP